MHNTTIIHKFALDRTIKNGHESATVVGIATDSSGSISYMLSIYIPYEKVWRRHWVTETELRGWEQVENA